MKLSVLAVILLSFLGEHLFTGSYSKSGTQLIRTLLSPDRYDRRVIPTSNNGTARVAVKIGVVIEHLNQLSDKREELHWAGFIRVIWQDPMLAWEPEKWNGQKYIFLKEDDVWVPDVSILERLDDDIGFKPQKRRLLYITFRGEIKWVLGGDLIVTKCPLHVYKFPFDRQTCTMLVGPYTMSHAEIDLVDPKQSGYSPLENQNALWRVTGTESKVVNYTYVNDLGTMRFDFIQFKLHLARKSGYYVINIIAPLLLMSGLMIVTFVIPPDSGEKIGFGITLLLAFNVIQLVITEHMPQTSESLPVMTVYCTLLLGMSALLIPLCAFSIYVDKYGYDFLPARLQKLLIRSRTPPSTSRATANDNGAVNNSETNHSATNHNYIDDNGHVEFANLRTRKPVENTGPDRERSQNDLLEILARASRTRIDAYASEESESADALRFRNAARSIDAFFMLVFSVVLVLGTLLCGILLLI